MRLRVLLLATSRTRDQPSHETCLGLLFLVAQYFCYAVEEQSGDPDGGRLSFFRSGCTLAGFELGDEFPTRDRSNHPGHHRTEDP